MTDEEFELDLQQEMTRLWKLAVQKRMVITETFRNEYRRTAGFLIALPIEENVAGVIIRHDRPYLEEEMSAISRIVTDVLGAKGFWEVAAEVASIIGRVKKGLDI